MSQQVPDQIEPNRTVCASDEPNTRRVVRRELGLSRRFCVVVVRHGERDQAAAVDTLAANLIHLASSSPPPMLPRFPSGHGETMRDGEKAERRRYCSSGGSWIEDLRELILSYLARRAASTAASQSINRLDDCLRRRLASSLSQMYVHPYLTIPSPR